MTIPDLRRSADWSAYRGVPDQAYGGVDLSGIEEEFESPASTVVAEAHGTEHQEGKAKNKSGLKWPAMPSFSAPSVPRSLQRVLLIGMGVCAAHLVAVIHAVSGEGWSSVFLAFIFGGPAYQVLTAILLLVVLGRSAQAAAKLAASGKHKDLLPPLRTMPWLAGVGVAAEVADFFPPLLVVLPASAALFFLSLWVEGTKPETAKGKITLHTWIRASFLLSLIQVLLYWAISSLG